MPKLTLAQQKAIKLLNALDGRDPERMHSEADDIIISILPDEVSDAYNRLVERTGRWWFA